MISFNIVDLAIFHLILFSCIAGSAPDDEVAGSSVASYDNRTNRRIVRREIATDNRTNGHEFEPNDTNRSYETWDRDETVDRSKGHEAVGGPGCQDENLVDRNSTEMSRNATGPARWKCPADETGADEDDFLTGNEILTNTTDLFDEDNCTNDYCLPHDDYMDIIEDYVFPTFYEWILITAHSVTFIVGLVGNALVCLAVYRNHSMRSVTNYFIVNLAVADFMVILFCLPPTVIWDVTETWFLGAAMCKVILYLQTVSITVSVLTLTFISIDRWYAICYPLKFKSTTGRAKTAIIIIWLIALIFDIPELVTLTTEKRVPRLSAVYFTQCRTTWSPTMAAAWSAIKMLLLYALPLAFTSIAYRRIVKVLWHAGGCQNSTTMSCGDRTAEGVTDALTSADTSLDGSRHGSSHNSRIVSDGGGVSFGGQGVSRSGRSTFTMNANASTEGQLRSRRKAAKMLVAVVIMFAVCYFPVHVFTLMKYLTHIPQTDGLSAVALLSHWLCYANSAVNPIIYNFMSGKYRREFKRAFGQCQRVRRRPISSRTCDETLRNSAFSPRGIKLYCNAYRQTARAPDAVVRETNIGHESSTRTRVVTDESSDERRRRHDDNNDDDIAWK